MEEVIDISSDEEHSQILDTNSSTAELVTIQEISDNYYGQFPRRQTINDADSYNYSTSSDDSILEKPTFCVKRDDMQFEMQKEQEDIDSWSTSTSDVDDEIAIVDLLNSSVRIPEVNKNTAEGKNSNSISTDNHIQLISFKKEKTPHYIGNKLYIPIEEWNGLEVVHVEKLPFDIDGTCIFQLPYNKENPMESSKDGRNWDKYRTSKRKGFHGVRRLAACKGGFVCDNNNCSYLKEYGKANRHHFKGCLCQHCSHQAQQVACLTRKIWEFNAASSTVQIYHYGSHSCQLKPKRNPEMEHLILNQFKSNTHLKPSQIPQVNIYQAIEKGNWDDIEKMSETLCDTQHIKNLKKKALKEVSPLGHSFEALGLLKQSTDKKDKFFIYEINDRRLNGEPSFVFKTSKFKLGLLNQMNKTGNHMLSKEYAHIDGKANRCPGYCTITLSVYHSILQAQIPLVIMEGEGESTVCIRKFWALTDKALAEYGTDKFNPFGLISDESGAFWKAALENFDNETMGNSVSCEFHFKENINRHSNSFSHSGDKDKFKKICLQWLEVTTINGYQTTKGILENFIEKCESKKDLRYFVNWWDSKRIHWSRAYKCDLFTPRLNQAEVINASLQHRGSVKVTLLAAAKDDTINSISIETLWRKYSEGMATSGSGQSTSGLTQRQHVRQKRDAILMGAELEKMMEEGVINAAPKVMFEINESCKHRPLTAKERKKRKRSSAFTYSSSEDEDDETTSMLSKRPCRLREKPSKLFVRSLEKAKSEHKKFSVQDMEEDESSFLFTIKSKKKMQVTSNKKFTLVNTYTVKIAVQPTCNCEFSISKKGDVCKHVIWVLMNLFKCHTTNRILYQKGYTLEEYQLLKGMFVGIIPEHLKYSPACSTKINGDNEEQATNTTNEWESIFAKVSEPIQSWTITHFKKQAGRAPACKTCKNIIQVGQLHVIVDGLYVPEGQKFATKCKFRFCPDRKCLLKVPYRSNLKPCKALLLNESEQFTDEEIALCMETHLLDI